MLIGLLLCLGVTSAAPQPPATPTVPAPGSQVGASSLAPTAPTALNIEAFNLVSPTTGWLLANQHLYWTTTRGQSWEDISPPEAQTLAQAAVTFLDAATGWVILTGSGAGGQPVYDLAQTADGGHTWQSHPLNLFTPGEVQAQAGAVYLQVIDSQTAWLVVKQATGSNFSVGTLFGTRDGGQTWIRRSLPIGAPVYFATTLVGWTAGGAAGNELYRTLDGGQTWSAQLPAGLTGAPSHQYLPAFQGARSGVLPVITSEGDQSRVEFHVTADGGQTWPLAAQVTLNSPAPGAALPLALLDARHWVLVAPHTQQVIRTSDGGATTTVYSVAAAAHLDALAMTTPDAGWAEYTSNDCVRAPATGSPSSSFQMQCQTAVKLLATADGGQTWADLQLPPALVAAAAAVTSTTIQSGPGTAGGVSPQGLGGLTQAWKGQGFDACDFPTEAQLLDWSAHSPYTAVGLYLGGSMALQRCLNATPNAATLQRLAQQGWRFIPIWVGPQAACSSFSLRMSSVAATAYAQGIQEANAAIAAAANLGLTLSDQSGTIIYYDLEAYNVNDAGCRAAAKAFVSGWSGQLRSRNNQSGVYGAACTSFLGDFAASSPAPDEIWAAAWSLPPQYSPTASVYNLACLDNSLWSNHQRLHQYAGGHAEAWGSTSLGDIDSDVLDGVVAVEDVVAPIVAVQIYALYYNSPFRDFQVLISASDSVSPITTYDLQMSDNHGPWTDAMTNTTNTVYSFVGTYGHTYDFRARARDQAGNQSVYPDSGFAEHTIPPLCPVPAGSLGYEPDNTMPLAQPITPDGSLLTRYIDVPGDQDWVTFPAVAGQRYTLATNNLGGFADTVIQLFNASGQSLAYNDDDPTNWPASRIFWRAPAAATYYLKVWHYDQYAEGCTTKYSVMVAPAFSRYLPLMMHP